MFIKSSCRHCKGPIEFEDEHTGEIVKCPHCGVDTILMVPKITAPAPAPASVPMVIAVPERKSSPKRQHFVGRAVVLILFAIGGLLLMGQGFFEETSAKSAMHEITAAVTFCGGAVVFTLAILGSILIKIGDAYINRK